MEGRESSRERIGGREYKREIIREGMEKGSWKRQNRWKKK